jgi:hypothetical protein
MPGYDLRPISLDEVRDLCTRFHGYGSAGGIAVAAFGVFEGGSVVAAFAWQPPPPGAARSVCPEAPSGVLALSRMVAVPRTERQLNHVSKPLRRQMRTLIDRGRWPVLVTWSDFGQGHTGHVYRCSGWTPTLKAERGFRVDGDGRRVSRYANGRYDGRGIEEGGTTTLQRQEHRACPPGEALAWMEAHGWRREPVPGKVWRSGNPAFTWRRIA